MKEYKKLLATLGQLLKSEGFYKKGETFYIQTEGNWGIINFQKSRDSTKVESKFTINLGVWSKNVAASLDDVAYDKPEIEVCHWSKRVGFLLPQNRDFWWIVSETTPLDEKLIDELKDIVKTKAIPEIKNHASDESLKNDWISGHSEGITEFQRYSYLTALLSIINDERLKRVVDEFLIYSKGKSIEFSAIEHLKQLNNYVK